MIRPCELCEVRPVLRTIDFHKESGRAVFLQLCGHCIRRFLGD